VNHKKPTTLQLTLAMAALTGGIAVRAHADPLQDLKDQVDALLKKVAALEQKQRVDAAAPAKPAPADVVTGGSTKGSFKLPGSNTSVTLGGYIKFDAIYSDRSAGVGSSADQEYEAGAVPVGPGAGANERGQIKLHARQSRFFAKTSTPTNLGELGTYLEVDLFGTAGNESVSNSHNLRVRHAYGSLGGLLMGQTWTNFSDPAAYPETVDFGGPAGTIFARQPQVRWTQQFDGGQWAVALENPETVASLGNGASFRADDDRFPDLTANVRFDTALGRYSVAALVREVRVDSASDPASRSAKWGGGFGVNAVIPSIGSDDLRLSAYYGNALGRYTVGFFNDALLDSDARVVLPNQWLATAAYRHYWSPQLRSTLALSTLRSANPAGTAGTVNKSADSAHVNLIWSPFAQTNFGVEYIFARREIENGQSGKLNRLQVAGQYLF
jgi:hypothetical protein